MLTHGVYDEELDDVDPTELLRYYSVDRPYTYEEHDVDCEFRQLRPCLTH